MRSLFTLLCLCLSIWIQAQPGYTANDAVTPYTNGFRAGVNLGIFPPWTDEQLGDLAAGNEDYDLPGVGAKALRPALFEHFVEKYGYELRVPVYEHYKSIGLEDHTLIVGFPTDTHRDPTNYCDGVQSELFKNLYLDIWDNGENGTPVNDENHYALYLYKLIQHYGPYIKFWEIWNEPGFDFTGSRGWAEPGTPGNWWENNPDPCDYKLRAPIFHYIRILRISWEVIKTLAPEDYVVVSGVGFPSFLDVLLRNTDNPAGGFATSEYPLTGGAYFDVMGYHAYPHFDGTLREWDNSINDFAYERHSDAAADGLITSQNDFQQVLNKYGYNGAQYPKKEWMITECNVPRKAFANYIGSDEAQRNFVAKAAIQCQKNDFIQLHIYKIGEDIEYDNATFEFDLMGLYEKLAGDDPFYATPTEAGIAYKTASDEIFEKTYDPQRTAQMNMPSNVDGGAFRDQLGNYTYILWAKTETDQSENASVVYDFPQNFDISQLVSKQWDYGYTREQSVISSAGIQLGASPIYLEEARFIMDKSVGCLPLDVQFSDQLDDPGLSRRWSFEAGTPATSTERFPSVTFSETGFHKITLEWIDAQGNIVGIQENEIFVQEKPQIDVAYAVSGPTVVLTNNTGLSADEFFWDFGDGTSSREPSPDHVYFTSGTFTIQLTATNECGTSNFEFTVDVQAPTTSRVPYTAKDKVPVYNGPFRPGTNMGVYQGWKDEELAEIAAGNIQKNIPGAGAKAVRPILDEKFLEKWGYDIRLETFQEYINLDLQDNTLMVGFPSDAHRDPNFYCATHQSELFDNLYTDIWDDGSDGTPYNDENYYAAYLYKVVTRYKDFVKFWEIWNEPSFDYSNNGWKGPGLVGNWWENNPHPCDYKLRAPIFHYIRILRISYEIIKSQDEDAMVALSGVAFPSFLDAILRNTDNPLDGSIAPGYTHKGGAYFDVMGFHTYPHIDGSVSGFDQTINAIAYNRHSDAAIGGITSLQDRFKDLLADYGYDGNQYPAKHWIITEAHVPRRSFGNIMGSEILQRNYLMKAYIESMRKDFLQIHVYKIGEDKKFYQTQDEFDLMGLYQDLNGVGKYNQTINQGGIGFKTTSDIIFGTQYDWQQTQQMNLPGNIDGGAFRDANGKYIYVLWAKTTIDNSESASATYSFPASMDIGSLTKRDWNYSQTGQTSSLGSSNVVLTGTPIFLLEASSPIQPPLAAFGRAKQIGCIPFEVQFNDESVRATSRRWTFVGGTPAVSTAQNPRITYNTPGIYPVTLEVSNRAGTHTATYLQHVDVKTVPNSDFTFEVNGNQVNFLSVGGYSDSITYFWYYGDGYSTGALEPEHYYFENGAYEVEMIATNSCGSTSTKKTVYIQSPPKAEFTKVVTTQCPAHEVRFYDLSPAQPDEWLWSFPGGIPATSTERNPVIQFDQGGDYEATLIVTNSFGQDTMVQYFTLSEGIESYVTRQFCNDESLVINGTIYDVNNPSGKEVIQGLSPGVCDSIVFIDLTYATPTYNTINPQLCYDEELWINNQQYNQQRPSGTEIITGGNAAGCDSVITIDLSFYPQAETTVQRTLCREDGYYIVGTLYNVNNPSGTAILNGQAQGGCDSIINIDLDFWPVAETFMNFNMCVGESIIVNGKVYDQQRTTGTEIIDQGSSTGCDSTIFVDLIYFDEATSTIRQQLCTGGSMIINGRLYDENNSSGTERILGGSAVGCDSVITIDLSFGNFVETTIDASICEGDAYSFNGRNYISEGNYSTTLQSIFGCDSIVYLNLSVTPPDETAVEIELCEGDIYRGISYYTNTVLTDSMQNQRGCDSIVFNFIYVSPSPKNSIGVSVCEGRYFHGRPYFNDTTIIERYQTVDGCDSLLTVAIDVISTVETYLSDTIYLTETYTVGTSTYNTGGNYTDTLRGRFGCDSIVYLNLTIIDAVSTSAIEATDFLLEAIPNPFNSELTVRFELPLAAKQVTLDLIDLHGRIINTMIEGQRLGSGQHGFTFRNQELAAGVYSCRLVVGNRVAVIRVVKL